MRWHDLPISSEQFFSPSLLYLQHYLPISEQFAMSLQCQHCGQSSNNFHNVSSVTHDLPISEQFSSPSLLYLQCGQNFGQFSQNVNSILMSHNDDHPPQGLLVILVLVLLRCLGDQVYGLLQGVARHGRHSTKLPAL